MSFLMRFLTILSPLFFAAPAWAANGDGGLMGNFGVFFPLIALIAIFYFFVIRPQNKRLREHRELVAGLRRGDVVVTAGGIIGKVHRVGDESDCIIEIADNIRVKVIKTTITGKHASAESAAATSGKDSGKDKE